MKNSKFLNIFNIIAFIIGILDIAFLIFGVVEFILYILQISFVPLPFFIIAIAIVTINIILLINLCVYLFIRKHNTTK